MFHSAAAHYMHGIVLGRRMQGELAYRWKMLSVQADRDSRGITCTNCKQFCQRVRLSCHKTDLDTTSILVSGGLKYVGAR